MYEFGSFRLDPAERLLLCDGKPIALSAKAFEVLLILVENSGRLVTKSELIQTLWPNTFVEEGNLTQNISVLRKALGGSDNGKQYIATVPKLGYRFTAPVTEVSEQPDETRDFSGPVKVPTSRRYVLPALAAVVTVALASVFFFLKGKQDRIDSVAVLPFTVVSSLPDSEYLADGIAESIIRNLTQMPDLKVASFASVARFKGAKIDDVQVLGKQLGVRAVLSTRVLQRDDEVSINTELVDTKDYRRHWGQQYRRKLSDIIGLQEEIAKDISEKLQKKLKHLSVQ